MLRRDHQLRADLGRIYSFSLGLRMEEDGTYRRPDVMACRIYARQTLEDIARSQDDPFNYRLLDLWLDVFQRPWDQPTTLHQLLDDLARQVGSGDLKVYLEYDPNLEANASRAGKMDAQKEIRGESDEADAIRTQTAQSGQSNADPQGLRLAERRGNPPSSLNDAVQRLESMSDEIAANGYKPKYSDEELKDMAGSGDVADERYHVRIMESRHLEFPDGSPGMLGKPFEGKTGNGAKYWSTTFDQLEDADLDPELVSGKVGLDYDPDTEYALIVIDTAKAQPLTGAVSVPATFDKVSEFANRELPKEFPPEFTNKTMNEDFQTKYAAHHEKAVREGYLQDEWSSNTKDFQRYLDANQIDRDEQTLLKKRMKMQDKIGNNQYFEGNGLTQDKINSSSNQYGAVETLNFERSKINLAQLKERGAINEPIKL